MSPVVSGKWNIYGDFLARLNKQSKNLSCSHNIHAEETEKKHYFFLNTENESPQALQTILGPSVGADGYEEKSEFGVNLKGPVPPVNPDCWPLTAPVPMTSFSSPQQEAHIDVAPAFMAATAASRSAAPGNSAP